MTHQKWKINPGKKRTVYANILWYLHLIYANRCLLIHVMNHFQRDSWRHKRIKMIILCKMHVGGPWCYSVNACVLLLRMPCSIMLKIMFLKCLNYRIWFIRRPFLASDVSRRGTKQYQIQIVVWKCWWCNAWHLMRTECG